MLRRQPRSARRASQGRDDLRARRRVPSRCTPGARTAASCAGWVRPRPPPSRPPRRANDPSLAEPGAAQSRAGTAPSRRVPQVAPALLARLNLGLSFDPALQPRYALSATQPLLARTRHEAAIDLHGQVVYDTSGRMDGILGLRYHNRWDDQDVSLDLQGGRGDHCIVGLQRYRLGAEGRLSSLEVRANLYDDVPARPASHEIAEAQGWMATT